MQAQNERDKWLVDAKRAGMTYQEIRKTGNFSEAVSTLRGRHRALTTPKELRVRKPEWTKKDKTVRCSIAVIKDQPPPHRKAAKNVMEESAAVHERERRILPLRLRNM
ncbi:MAG: hypothetical protein M1817_005888 [Caeruleum heppii]|nr:MAG: hypothetical protein M1817_005888 [Caeruleum heppii]